MRTLRQVGLLAVTVIAIAIATGCTGFFVNPTLSSISIGPQNQTITASPKQTLQMSATGTFSDGSTQDLTGKVLWTSGTPSCATISGSGLVTPASSVAGVCTTTISAADGTVSAATTTVTVSQGTPTSIQLNVSTNSPAPATSVTFTALATFPGVSGQQDITSSVVWINSDATDLPLTQGSGVANLSGNASAGATITVQASFDGVLSNTQTLTVQ